MTSRSELTLFERGEIIGAWKCGLSEEKISVALKRAPSTHKPFPYHETRKNYGRYSKKNGTILVLVFTKILLIACHVELLQLLKLRDILLSTNVYITHI